VGDPSRSFVLIVNPKAGAGRAEERIPLLEGALREAGAPYELVLTRHPGDGTTQVRKALTAGYGGVAIVGGDGSLNEAVNGFFDEHGVAIAPDAWLGPLPCGTGGDFRRTLGIGHDVAAMVTRLLWAKPRPIDVGWLTFHGNDGSPTHRAFVNIASFGLGGLVDRLVNDGPKWIGGKPAFLLGTVRAAARYRNRRVRLRLDAGPSTEVDVVNVAVANGQYFGGGMHIAPNATIDDGLFDVVTIEGRPFLQQAMLTPHLYRGAILGQPGVTCTRAKKVVAEAADFRGPILLDVDGEAPGMLPATFEVRPGALRLRG
jgi:YegS/Rv2252/BmrU family lipid kinase